MASQLPLFRSLNRKLDTLKIGISSGFSVRAPALEPFFALRVLLLLAVLFFLSFLEVVVGFLGQCRSREWVRRADHAGRTAASLDSGVVNNSP